MTETTSEQYVTVFATFIASCMNLAMDTVQQYSIQLFMNRRMLMHISHLHKVNISVKLFFCMNTNNE